MKVDTKECNPAFQSITQSPGQKIFLDANFLFLQIGVKRQMYIPILLKILSRIGLFHYYVNSRIYRCTRQFIMNL